MTFHVGRVPSGPNVGFYLKPVRWDDNFKFQTTFDLVYVDPSHQVVEIGLVKVGKAGMVGSDGRDPAMLAHRTPPLPTTFEELGSSFFSVGQSPDYYERLHRISTESASRTLQSLRDVAFAPALFEKFFDEPVMRQSLLREISSEAVTGQFARIAFGGHRRIEWMLEFSFGISSKAPLLKFQAGAGGPRPSNLHALIGSNGVGKSRFLYTLADHYKKMTVFDRLMPGDKADNRRIANVVLIAFSAFDQFPIVDQPHVRGRTPSIHYVGLRTHEGGLKNVAQLRSDLVSHLKLALAGQRRGRLESALSLLQLDPGFERRLNAQAILDLPPESLSDERLVGTVVASATEGLSSGHFIVLLTVVALVGLVEERSLVLLDEPEAHLHPPLLALFVRTISDLLESQNGVAITATHSPVVLQDVPSECVWIVRRRGDFVRVDRPAIETFGEGVGPLTREVFGLEVDNSGFMRRLLELRPRYESHTEALAALGDVGFEGQLAVRQLWLEGRDVES